VSQKHKNTRRPATPAMPPKKPTTAPAAAVERTVTPSYRIVGAGLALLAILLYLNTLGHGFVLDDPLSITKNSTVQKGIGAIPELLVTHYRMGTEGANASALLYRPLSLITFAIEWSIAPNNAAIGHFMSVLWYALSASMLFFALRRLFRGYHWAWAAASVLLFVAHPLHTEVVANIKSRDEILSVFFGAAALYSWARWLGGEGGRWLAIAIGAYLLALLSKESAMTLLPVFPLAAYFFYDRNARSSATTGAWPLVAVLIFLGMRAAAFAKSKATGVIDVMDNPIVEADFSGRLATGFSVLWRYVELLVLPKTLLSDYSYRHLTVANWSDWRALAGLTLYAGMAAGAVWGLLRRHPLAFCAIGYLAAISLYSQIPIVIGTLFGERLAYLPSVWFCAGVAFLVLQLSRFVLSDSDVQAIRAPYHPGLLALYAIAAFFGILTVLRNPDWASNYTLFTADSPKAPNSVRLHNGVAEANYLLAATDDLNITAEQKKEYARVCEAAAKAAIAIRPNPASYINLGNVALAEGRFAEGEPHYLEAIKLAPNYDLPRNNLVLLYSMWARKEAKELNNLSAAIPLFEKAIQYGSKDALLFADLGTAYGMSGNNAKALQYFEKASQLDPGNKNVWNNLGTAYQLMGNAEKAAECFRRAK
jgi:protein O-mannosyl-transferase